VAAQPHDVREFGLGDDDGVHVLSRLGVGKPQPAGGRRHAELAEQAVHLGAQTE
jgi:hypothetical protein